MWWDRSERIDVYLAPSLLGFSTVEGDALWRECRGIEDALEALRKRIEERESRASLRLRVRLASTLARPWTLPADCGAKDGREAHALAAMMAREVFSEDNEPRVWCAAWRPARPMLAVAMSRHLWSQLEAFADAPQVRLESVRPWWNEVFDDRLARSQQHVSSIGFSLREPDGLVSVHVDRGQVVDAAFEPPKVHDPHWRALRRRLAANWHDVQTVESLDFLRAGALGSAALAAEVVA